MSISNPVLGEKWKRLTAISLNFHCLELWSDATEHRQKNRKTFPKWHQTQKSKKPSFSKSSKHARNECIT